MLRRVLALATYVMAGFNAEADNPRRPDQTRSRLRHCGLLDDLGPDERAFPLDAANPTPAQVADATWHSEALVALQPGQRRLGMHHRRHPGRVGTPTT